MKILILYYIPLYPQHKIRPEFSRGGFMIFDRAYFLLKLAPEKLSILPLAVKVTTDPTQAA